MTQLPLDIDGMSFVGRPEIEPLPEWFVRDEDMPPPHNNPESRVGQTVEVRGRKCIVKSYLFSPNGFRVEWE